MAPTLRHTGRGPPARAQARAPECSTACPMRAKGCGKLFRQSLQSARLQYSASTNCFLFSYTYMYVAQTGNSLPCSPPVFIACGTRPPLRPGRTCTQAVQPQPPRVYWARTRTQHIKISDCRTGVRLRGRFLAPPSKIRECETERPELRWNPPGGDGRSCTRSPSRQTMSKHR